MKTCFKAVVGLGFPVKLEQYANGLFRVTYGKHVTDKLDYAEAAKELGECLMHGAACQGNLDNGYED